MPHSEASRLGAKRQHELYDPRETTKKAREVFLSRFKDEAEKRAYFVDLGRKGGRVKRERDKNEV